jgi:hypothetical protein
MTVIDVTERPVFKLGPELFRIVYPSGIASGEAFGTARANASVTAVGVAPAGAVGTASTTASIAVTGINAGSGAAGTPAVRLSVNPTGIAAPGSLGQPQVNAQVTTQGVPSGSGVGTPTAFTSMNPTGFSATGGGLGTPSLTMVMSPTGIASAEAFGDADTLATVFIIPGPYDPTNDFGNATATKKGWIFRPPVNTYQWRLFKEYEGISLLKESGVWSEVAHPDLERTRAAQVYLAGGRDHVVGDALKAELIAEGYTVTEEFVTTEEYL